MTMDRRNFLRASGLTAAALTTAPYLSAKAYESDLLPQDSPALNPGEPYKDYVPVTTPNGRMLPYRIVDGVKVFHLIAQEVLHERRELPLR